MRGYGRFLRPLYNLGDIALYNVMFALSLHIVDSWALSLKWLLWLLVNVSYIAVIVRNRSVRHKDRTLLMDRVVASSLLDLGTHALFFLSLTQLVYPVHISWKLFVAYYALLAVVIPLFNVVSRQLVKIYRRRGFNYTRVLIVGSDRMAERLREQMDSDPGFGYRLLGFSDVRCNDTFLHKDKYIGDLDCLASFVADHKVDQIYYALPMGEGVTMQKVIKVADDNCVDFFIVPPTDPALGRGFMLHNIGAMPVLACRQTPLKLPLNSMFKRMFDLAASSIFLVTLYPLVYLPVAIAIKASSPGPVYFRQKRTGYGGRSFDCLKFRTMRVNSQADTCQATANDKRKTRIGDLLRRTSIDELPQFINVWKGDMSVVGPRPHMLKHTEDYSKLIDRYMVRHLVKPGITGWAQVNGFRGVTDQLWKMERRVEHDVWYIENWTFLLDLKIIVRTILNALHGERNAY